LSEPLLDSSASFFAIQPLDGPRIASVLDGMLDGLADTVAVGADLAGRSTFFTMSA
jgi:hypothetical protein